MAITALGFGIGAILIIVGIILLIIGTVFYNNKINSDECVSSWIWIMVAIGILLMIVGLLIVLAAAFRAASNKCKKEKQKGCEVIDYHEEEDCYA